MNTITVVAIAIAVLAIAFGIFMYVQTQRTRHLRSKFGPEYDRLVDQYKDPRKAEEDLSHRERRVQKLHIRDLTADEANRFAEAWQEEQARFVDTPREAVANADRLVGELMKARGYPMGEFEQRAADISVDHPLVVENYRAAHDLAGRSRREDVSTEDLRQAMVHYRALFGELLGHDVRHIEEVKK
jgi:FtsZ-interacting cell division protein ZipA